MAPYFFKEGDMLREWNRAPKDIRNGSGKGFGVTVFGVGDPEQIRVYVDFDAQVYSLGKRGTLIFPGQEAVLNRDSFGVIDAKTRKTLSTVIYRKPIK